MPKARIILRAQRRYVSSPPPGRAGHGAALFNRPPATPRALHFSTAVYTAAATLENTQDRENVPSVSPIANTRVCSDGPAGRQYPRHAHSSIHQALSAPLLGLELLEQVVDCPFNQVLPYVADQQEVERVHLLNG